VRPLDQRQKPPPLWSAQERGFDETNELMYS
jgi:hypothetical protein